MALPFEYHWYLNDGSGVQLPWLTVNVCPRAGVPVITGLGLELNDRPAVTDSVEAEVTVVVVKPDWVAVIRTEMVLPTSAEVKT